MIRALVLLAPLVLSGCGLGPTVIISAVGLGFTAAKDVIGIDISLSQSDPTKTPLSAIVAPPPVAAPAVIYEPPAPQLPLSYYEPGDGTGHHTLTPPVRWHYAVPPP